eukprot:5400001-Prymnesium_polylepis.1
MCVRGKWRQRLQDPLSLRRPLSLRSRSTRKNGLVVRYLPWPERQAAAWLASAARPRGARR